MSGHNNDELVNVLVPKSYLMDVYRFLAACEQETNSSSANKTGSDNASKDNRNQW